MVVFSFVASWDGGASCPRTLRPGDYREPIDLAFEYNFLFLNHFVLHGTNLNNNKLEAKQLCHAILQNQTLPKCLALVLNCWDVALLIPVTRLKVQKKTCWRHPLWRTWTVLDVRQFIWTRPRVGRLSSLHYTAQFPVARVACVVYDRTKELIWFGKVRPSPIARNKWTTYTSCDIQNFVSSIDNAYGNLYISGKQLQKTHYIFPNRYE